MQEATRSTHVALHVDLAVVIEDQRQNGRVQQVGMQVRAERESVAQNSIHQIAELFGTDLAVEIPLAVESMGFGFMNIAQQAIEPRSAECAEAADPGVMGIRA